VIRSRPIVLVVENNQLQRMFAATRIKEADCDVVEAENADEAIAILEAKEIRIVFTDIDMPGSMDG
jgi:CheY-like chemotaxis protein